MKDKKLKSLALTSVFTALSASLCCISPLMVLLAGTSGVASSFSWVAPYRPWLIGITVLVLAFAWYQQLKSKAAEDCACDNDEKPSFWQSKKFLGLVTVFAGLMLAFPYYAEAFYPEAQLSQEENAKFLPTYAIDIKGMTCAGCEDHVKLEIAKLPGISGLEVSYEKANALVTFDEAETNLEEVKAAIAKTGYKVLAANKTK